MPGACPCASNCYGHWRCQECSELERRNHEAQTLTPIENQLLHKCGRRTKVGDRKGPWVQIVKRRKLMACPTPGCYGKPWYRHWRHIGDVGNLHKQSWPIGHQNAWYLCLSCQNQIQIPPAEDPQATVIRQGPLNNLATGTLITNNAVAESRRIPP